MIKPNPIGASCPLPIADHPKILMAHGGGGRMMAQLIDRVFRAAFDNRDLQTTHDGAVLDIPQDRLVMTTDSFVVRPLFFPGGDIGALAVNGTVNDLSMCGAQPQYLSASFILEEGLEMETLWQIAQSMGRAADTAGIHIVTGDTKVVERGHGDGIYINTTGIGVLEHDARISPARVKPGDAVLLSGNIGCHGMAVMAQRENLTFTSPIQSDCAPLAAPVMALLKAGIDVHCLRDATRGGLAALLNEIATAAGLQISCRETAIPVDDAVHGACEILGLDPLHVANEGRFAAFVAAKDAGHALEIMKQYNEQAALIGTVTNGKPGMVTVQTPIGGQRILDMPSGELLPRIC
ncbi:hydrogenase expression/formation protein HypE [Nitrosococcus oceani]|uniref:hydrogenase expression/formation protein HypE n=1 Tax=Nitrosococcus oceani TaxID=1229 RepID=UPI0004E87D39|nr:hydrogenase expression/formation protein HypE [Nitrosococcus oceani]KFI21627.1 hydrogenase [Nitrosococcus oceani]